MFRGGKIRVRGSAHHAQEKVTFLSVFSTISKQRSANEAILRQQRAA